MVGLIPVVPPDWRPIYRSPAGALCDSTLTKLYQNVIRANESLKPIIRSESAVESIKLAETTLQRAVDAVFNYGVLAQAGAEEIAAQLSDDELDVCLTGRGLELAGEH